MSLTEFIEPKECSDDSIDEKMLAVFDAYEKKFANGTYILNPKRVNEFIIAFQYLKNVFEPGCSVTYNQRETGASTGWDMFVRGESLRFIKTQDLVDHVLSKADCFEVSAYLDGTVELAVTFYDMMTKGK